MLDGPAASRFGDRLQRQEVMQVGPPIRSVRPVRDATKVQPETEASVWGYVTLKTCFGIAAMLAALADINAVTITAYAQISPPKSHAIVSWRFYVEP